MNVDTCTSALASRFAVTLAGPVNATGTMSCDGGAFKASVGTSVAGTYALNVWLDGTRFVSEQTITVQPAALSAPNTTCDWPARLPMGEARFPLHAHDIYGNVIACTTSLASAFTVELSGTTTLSGSVSCDGADFAVFINTTQSGHYAWAVKYAGQDIPGSGSGFEVFVGLSRPYLSLKHFPLDLVI